MYDLPSLRNVQKVVVDEQVIEGQNKPYIVHRTEETRLVAPVEEAAAADGLGPSLTGWARMSGGPRLGGSGAD